jgi:hypothetical protein
VRLCDLGLAIAGTPLERRVERLYRELARAGLAFRPPVWLSTGWFSPEGVPGFAIPFYLAHPRLARLEREQMLQVEGGNLGWCMKLLRHEAGHALDTAYRLRRRPRFREVFGPAGAPYGASYVPKPESRRFVLHLFNFYAQSHPVEDFAETFAVWLRPGSRWRSHYRGWPAERKLLFVDELMRGIAGQRPRVHSRERTDSLPQLRITLREYYRRKRAHYGRPDLSVYDRDLVRLFRVATRGRPAAGFLRARRRELVDLVTRHTGQHRFLVDDVLAGMIRRSEELGLRLAGSENVSGEGAAVLLALHTGRSQQRGRREYFR